MTNVINKIVPVNSSKAAWNDDKLNRRLEGEFLIDYLINKHTATTEEHHKNFVLNLNADWGFGKTFFLRNLFIELSNRDHQVIYFDAWKNDFSDKPMLGFIAEISEALSSFMKIDDPNIQKAKAGIEQKLLKLKSSAAPLMLGLLAKQLVGPSLDQTNYVGHETNLDIDLVKIDENIALNNSKITQAPKLVDSIATKVAELALKDHTDKKKSIDEFKVNLKDLVNYIEIETGFKLPLFILVDELDRCRPNYAIEVLETIKHLFDVDGVYFIVATASHQLSHSVNAIYGKNFESKRYLNRFFDQEYKLATPNQRNYCHFLWDKYISQTSCFEPLFTGDYAKEGDESINMNVVLIDLMAQYTKSGLRDVKQAIKLLQAINFTHKAPLYSILVIFLTFCKIRHPDAFIAIKNKWPDIFSLKLDEDNYINRYFLQEFDASVELSVQLLTTEGQSQGKVIALRSVLEELLQLDGVNPAEMTIEHNASTKDIIFTQLQRCINAKSVDSAKIKLTHYIEVIEQVGRLI